MLIVIVVGSQCGGRVFVVVDGGCLCDGGCCGGGGHICNDEDCSGCARGGVVVAVAITITIVKVAVIVMDVSAIFVEVAVIAVEVSVIVVEVTVIAMEVAGNVMEVIVIVMEVAVIVMELAGHVINALRDRLHGRIVQLTKKTFTQKVQSIKVCSKHDNAKSKCTPWNQN